MNNKVLYIGLDDSNHGEQQKRIGEIVVLSYSNNYRHCWKYKKMVNRRSYFEVSERFEEGIFDYVFTIVPHQLAKSKYSNLPPCTPFLLSKIPLKEKTKMLKCGLDGRLYQKDKFSLEEELLKDFHFSEITIKNFVKKNGVHSGPPLIYFADVIASKIFNSTINEISNDPRYFPLTGLIKNSYYY